MTPFLQLVADDLRQKFGTDLSHVAIICPNKRAGLFINEYLVPATEQATVVWAPQCLTISDLFRRLSPWTVCDTIDTVCRLYRHYVDLTKSTETLDFFYGWGERLLADFDDIDKNRVDAERIFRSISDIKAMEASADYIDEEKEKVLQHFFEDFSLQENSRLKTRFLELWNVMLPLYQRVNDDLRADGLAYEGALYRHVTEQLIEGSISLPEHITHYALVGFNVLSRVEEDLFSLLQQQGKALFYWDYDITYTAPGAIAFEAGTFLRHNLEKFPGELSAQHFDNLLHDKDIEFVSVPTENAGARNAAPWLKAHLTADEKRTAIVLCNEHLLQPLLHVLPPEVKEANITKGYPLSHTVISRLVEQEITARRPETSNEEWLTHLCEVIRQQAEEVAQKKDSLHKTLSTEACFHMHSIATRLLHLVVEGGLQLEAPTLHKLLRQIMGETSIPFSGEPAVGLQVMGVLETRCLDFENILLLSCGEGNLPRRVASTSLIPHSIRREFGLTTDRHKIAVYAYYFYRLIQRARHIRMVYNCSADSGRSTGEMSRFMTQLLAETSLSIRRLAISSPMQIAHREPTPIAKPKDLRTRLLSLSPSAINTYIRCQLQFYFLYVLRLKAPRRVREIIEPNVLGSAFHKSAEIFYLRLREKADGYINSQMLLPWLEKEARPTLLSIIRQAMQEEEAGDSVLVEGVILRFLLNLIKADSALPPFLQKATEEWGQVDLTLPMKDGAPHTVKIKGIIDRMDILNVGTEREILRILDYKTGGEAEAAKDIAQLFRPAKKHPHYTLQTLLYALFMEKKTNLPLQPHLFFVNKAAQPGYSSHVTIGAPKVKQIIEDARPLLKEYREGLVQLIAEIFDDSIDFQPTAFENNCTKCDFYELCRDYKGNAPS
jgi:RecB family exonuclease